MYTIRYIQYTLIHTYMDAYIHTYIHTYIHACMHACMHTYTCVYIYIYTIYIHSYTFIFLFISGADVCSPEWNSVDFGQASDPQRISKSQVKYGCTGKCTGAGIREVAILGWVLEILETLFGLWCESLGLPVNFLI